MSKNIDVTCVIRIGDNSTAIYYIKILKKGKDIYIKDQREFGNTKTTIKECLIINDNIEIPENIINIFEGLFTKVPYEGGFTVIQNYIDLLQKCKIELATTYEKKELEIHNSNRYLYDNKPINLDIISLKTKNKDLNLEIEKLKKENALLKDETFKTYFGKSIIKEENDKLKSQIEELNQQLKQNKIIKEENDKLKLQIEELNQQVKKNIINYYC
jgi:hypothetical protein